VLKTYSLLPPTSRTPFRQTNFSAFPKTLLSNSRSALLCPPQCTPSRTQFCEVFLHTAILTILANPANPVLIPWFILLFKYGGRESWGGGGGGGGGSEFNTYLLFAEPTQIYTSQPFSLHCNKKFIHAAGGHHGSRQNIRPYRTLRPDPC
jgi:hypothetical protein